MPDVQPPNPVPLRTKRGWMPLVVTSVRDDTWDTKTFFLEDAEDGGRAFDYRAGQYLTFRFDDLSSKTPVRSYTMSSAPCDGNFAAVTVKRVEGGLVSNWMCDHLKPGSILRARGPIGKFCYDPAVDQPRVVMVAAGSGVTPFLSIMKDLAARGPEPYLATLLVAFRSRNDIIGSADLQRLARYPGFRVQMTFSRDAGPGLPEGSWQGRVSTAHLDSICPQPGNDLGGTTYFTCGPSDMMKTVQTYLLAKGVAPECIKMESFES